MKTYIIASGDYFPGVDPKMTEFVGAWRALLLDVLGLKEEDDATVVEPRTVKDVSDDELVGWFDDANGDGQPWTQVWCVEDRKQVLG